MKTLLKALSPRHVTRAEINMIIMKLMAIGALAVTTTLPECMEDKVKQCESKMNIPEEQRFEKTKCVLPNVLKCALKRMDKNSCIDFEPREKYLCTRAECPVPPIEVGTVCQD
jgi:hypothetical protein